MSAFIQYLRILIFPAFTLQQGSATVRYDRFWYASQSRACIFQFNNNRPSGKQKTTPEENPQQHYPSVVDVDGSCNGLLLPGNVAKSSKEKSTGSKFLITTQSCIDGLETMKLSVSGKDLQHRKTIVYSLPDVSVDIAIVMLRVPVTFGDQMQPVALPDTPTMPEKDTCKVIGFSGGEDGSAEKLVTVGIESVTFAECGSGANARGFEELHKMCVTFTEQKCEMKAGSALICNRESVWTLYGLHIDGSQCSQRRAVYTRIDSLLQFWILNVMRQMTSTKSLPRDKILQTVLLIPPKQEASEDGAGRKILEYGQIFKAPLHYELKRIKKPTLLIGGSNISSVATSDEDGFHFADVLSYGIAQSHHHCMFLCYKKKGCYATNYVDGNHWCVLLATAHKPLARVGLWRGQDYGYPMKHWTFKEGKKSNPPSHKPRVDGAAKLLPAGTSPRMTSRSRIIKGQASSMFQYPWMVKIFGCGASLINEDLTNGKQTSSSLLLTAAHCIFDRLTGNLIEDVARLGAYRADMVNDVEHHIPLFKAVVHGGYDGGRPEKVDIALVQLEKPVQYNSYIGPVALPSPNSFPSEPKQCMTIGWGVTDKDNGGNVLNEIQVEAFTAEKCRSYYNGLPISKPETYTKNGLLCATAERNGRMVATCIGDSGGPLFCPEKINGQQVQVIYGLTRSGFGCDQELPLPPLFTNVSSMMGWIGRAASKIKVMKNMTVIRL